jgi:hypothetical protein
MTPEELLLLENMMNFYHQLDSTSKYGDALHKAIKIAQEFNRICATPPPPLDPMLTEFLASKEYLEFIRTYSLNEG